MKTALIFDKKVGKSMRIWEIADIYEQNKGKENAMQNIRVLFEEQGPDKVGKELVLLAARFAHIEALRWLLRHEVGMDVVDEYGYTPLHWVAKKEWRFYRPEEDDVSACTRLLISKGIDVLRRDNIENLCCYHYAARSGNYLFVMELVGEKLDITDRKGNTAVHLTCEYAGCALDNLKEATGRVGYASRVYNEATKRLRDSGSSEKDIACYCKNNRIKTPQQVREEYQYTVNELEGYYKTARAFVEAGINPDALNNLGKSALDIAVESGAKKIAAYLSGQNPEDATAQLIGGMSIHQSVEQGQLEVLSAIVERGDDLNTPSEHHGFFYGYTPLSIACALLNVDAVELLLEKGADINTKDNKGRRAICFIAKKTRNSYKNRNLSKKIVNIFLDADYDLNSTVNDDLDTLLGYYCKYHHKEPARQVMKELLCRKAAVNIANRFGETSLMHICKKDFSDAESIQSKLLENGADVSVKDNRGNTPLHYAAMNRSAGTARNMADMLFSYGKPNPQAANDNGKTPLALAIKANNQALVNLLLSKM